MASLRCPIFPDAILMLQSFHQYRLYHNQRHHLPRRIKGTTKQDVRPTNNSTSLSLSIPGLANFPEDRFIRLPCRSPIETSPASPIEMSRSSVCLRLVEVAWDDGDHDEHGRADAADTVDHPCSD